LVGTPPLRVQNSTNLNGAAPADVALVDSR